MYCDRPHESTIDFADARLVVGTAHGLNVNGRMLAMGEEIPRGALSADALRLEYETPLRRIELLDYAMKDPDLCDAVARHQPQAGVLPKAEGEPSPAPAMARKVCPDLNVSWRELAKICHGYGLTDRGSKAELQQRIRAHLGW